MPLFFLLFLINLSGLFIPNKTARNILFVFVWLGMTLLCGLRGKFVGTDTPIYVSNFINHSGSYEFLFQWLRDIIQYYGGSASDFLFVTALLTYIPLFWIINQASPNKLLSLFLFMVGSLSFFVCTFNTIRWSLAMEFSLCSVYCLIKKQWCLSLILFFIAFGFHNSVIVLPLILGIALLCRKMSQVTITILVGISLGLGIFSSFYQEVFDQIQILTAGTDFLDTGDKNYQTYLSNLEENKKNFVGILCETFPLSFLAIVSYRPKGNSIYYWLFLIGVLISNIFIQVKLIYRIGGYVLLFVILVIPMVLNDKEKTLNNQVRKWLIYLGIFMLIVTYLKAFFNTPSPANIFPYESSIFYYTY